MVQPGRNIQDRAYALFKPKYLYSTTTIDGFEVTVMMCERPAKIEEAAVREIQELEGKLGVTLVAYDRIPPFKKMTDADVARLKTVEKETGAILVAYEA